MSAYVAMYALLRLTIADPFQAYDFACDVHRPAGQALSVNGAIRGHDVASRTASISGASGDLAYGERLSVTLDMDDAGVIDRESFGVEREGVRYSYILDRSLPFENDAIGMTIVALDMGAEDPVKLSAMGFCAVENVADERPNP